MLQENYNGPNIFQSAVLTHNDYLDDESCHRIQKIIRNNFFSKINKGVHNQNQPMIIKKRESLIGIPQIKKPKSDNPEENLHIKQINFSNKIRKNNYDRIEKYRRIKNNFISMSTNDIINVPHNYNDYKQELENYAKGARKMQLPKLEKKPIKDRYEMKYEPNYIDNVEKLFINPYLVNESELYTDYIENKKSKIPLNFFI